MAENKNSDNLKIHRDSLCAEGRCYYLAEKNSKYILSYNDDKSITLNVEGNNEDSGIDEETFFDLIVKYRSQVYYNHKDIKIKIGLNLIETMLSMKVNGCDPSKDSSLIIHCPGTSLAALKDKEAEKEEIIESFSNLKENLENKFKEMKDSHESQKDYVSVAIIFATHMSMCYFHMKNNDYNNPEYEFKYMDPSGAHISESPESYEILLKGFKKIPGCENLTEITGFYNPPVFTEAEICVIASVKFHAEVYREIQNYADFDKNKAKLMLRTASSLEEYLKRVAVKESLQLVKALQDGEQTPSEKYSVIKFENSSERYAVNLNKQLTNYKQICSMENMLSNLKIENESLSIELIVRENGTIVLSQSDQQQSSFTPKIHCVPFLVRPKLKQFAFIGLKAKEVKPGEIPGATLSNIPTEKSQLPPLCGH